MRKPSILVPLGGAVATVGIYLPIVTVGLHVPGSKLPVLSDMVDSIPDKGLGASTDQRLYLLGMLGLAVAAWLLPLLVPRTKAVGIGLAIAAAAIAAIGAVRGWVIAVRGPGAVIDDHSSFLERTALSALDKLHSYGVLVIHPGSGLWTLSAGALVLIAGALLALRPAPSA
ncbi:hypothetical protein [Nocardioides marmorisolisilvae]|uniref:Uncharacterized protein n=1 Tax=Nocardioides marmorisolisilvae TaxID=1542737 RepID=A0A3N0DTR5_9ACTN|nr:hypothetical protein [Nocardioides marmorisolisilvae]RNL79018.1 hypothetical protein EFL95_08210 [Nocardioides marmorisolisilvae]